MASTRWMSNWKGMNRSIDANYSEGWLTFDEGLTYSTPP